MYTKLQVPKETVIPIVVQRIFMFPKMKSRERSRFKELKGLSHGIPSYFEHRQNYR